MWKLTCSILRCHRLLIILPHILILFSQSCGIIFSLRGHSNIITWILIIIMLLISEFPTTIWLLIMLPARPLCITIRLILLIIIKLYLLLTRCVHILLSLYIVLCHWCLLLAHLVSLLIHIVINRTFLIIRMHVICFRTTFIKSVHFIKFWITRILFHWWFLLLIIYLSYIAFSMDWALWCSTQFFNRYFILINW